MAIKFLKDISQFYIIYYSIYYKQIIILISTTRYNVVCGYYLTHMDGLHYTIVLCTFF